MAMLRPRRFARWAARLKPLLASVLFEARQVLGSKSAFVMRKVLPYVAR
jgi:hypothetical protein